MEVNATAKVLARARECMPGAARSLKLRAFLLAPERLAEHCPEEGPVFDLACGLGLLTLVIASVRPKCQVTGVDHDAGRVAQNTRLAEGLPNTRFVQADIWSYELPRDAAAVYIVDSLHYFTVADQSALLARAWASLRPGGKLVIRDVLKQFRPAYWWNWFHETLMTSRFGLTRTKGAGLHFRDRAAWDAELGRLADPPPVPSRAHRFIPYNDTLWVAIKK